MRFGVVQMSLGMLLVGTLAFGQVTLTDEQVAGAISRAFTAKRHQIGLTLNDMQTNLLSGLVCRTCKATGYTIYVYTPESWVELQAVRARREMLPFGLESVTPEMRLPYIHVLASPSQPEYLNANGFTMASSVHRVVLSSTDRSDVVQPLSESHSAVELNSALRSFTQASAGAVFSLEDVQRLRSEDSKGEFFIVVVGDKQNKYFKVKTRFFNQLFGRESEQATTVTERTNRKPASTNSFQTSRAVVPPQVAEHTSGVPTIAADPAPASPAPKPLISPVHSTGDAAKYPQSQSGESLVGVTVTTWEQGGAKIMKITPDSAAENAGLHVGDVIVSIQGKRVRSVNDFEAALINKASGATIKVVTMFHTNLGWMPGAEKTLTLGRGSD